MYKLVLCHRIKVGSGAAEFHDHWLHARSALVVRLKADLGYDNYGQTHQSSRLNPLYQSILFSRSRLVTSLVSTKKGPKPQSTAAVRSEERWDVTDEFNFASREALINAITSPAGTVAVGRLTADHAPWVRRTEVVTSEKIVAAPDPAPRPVDVRTVFFLRSRPELTREAMLTYWRDSHMKLVLSLQDALKYRAYNQLHVRSDAGLSDVILRFGGNPGEEFDGVAELCFTGQWDLVKGLFNPRTELANLKLVKDETNFIDGQRSALVFGNHYRFAAK